MHTQTGKQLEGKAFNGYVNKKSVCKTYVTIGGDKNECKKKKSPHTRVSFALTEDMKNELDKLSIKLHIQPKLLIHAN